MDSKDNGSIRENYILQCVVIWNLKILIYPMHEILCTFWAASYQSCISNASLMHRNLKSDPVMEMANADLRYGTSFYLLVGLVDFFFSF